MMAEEKKIGDHLPRKGATAENTRRRSSEEERRRGRLRIQLPAARSAVAVDFLRQKRGTKKAPVTLPFYRLPNETPGVDEQKPSLALNCLTMRAS